MEQLQLIGKIKAKRSSEIQFSPVGIGFEKLDRDVFDPEKAYDKIAACGVKKARIQSGWQRTEKEKGVYDFVWLDSIVDNLTARGIEPWICLCYGNPLYTEMAREVFGSVGCPPIFSEEERGAWLSYVRAVVSRYMDRVRYFEIWNEPDGPHCWKHGVNAAEYGEFTRETARLIKQINPGLYTVGGVVHKRRLAYLNTALQTGMGDYLDFVSFHEYTHDESGVFETVESYRALAKLYNPALEIIQGESGSQSRSGGHGALRKGAWTEGIQAKQLARHTIADLLAGVHFTSYFSTVDMIEALRGVVGDLGSYLDYGYFGVLGAEFDENGHSTGVYHPKPAYYTLQNICAIFSEDCRRADYPVMISPAYSSRKFSAQPARSDLTCGTFRRGQGYGFVYWKPANIMTESYCSSLNLEIRAKKEELHLIDVMDGRVYTLPDCLTEDSGDGICTITELPVKDTPLILTVGDFAEFEMIHTEVK